jgi:hypothetical protein
MTCSELVVPYSMEGVENGFYTVGSDEEGWFKSSGELAIKAISLE